MEGIIAICDAMIAYGILGRLVVPNSADVAMQHDCLHIYIR